MHIALTIAGSDSSGAAGIQADLKTFAALGVYGVSAMTAVTAQNTAGITSIEALAADRVTEQIEAVAGDVTIHATKIGMLATSAIVEAVAAAISELELPMVVLDPVIASTSGTRLLDDEGIQAMLTELIPRVRVITPNLPEAEVLSGRRIASPDDAREAARRIRDLGAGAVIIKGGHRRDAEIVDLLLDGDAFTEYRTPRVTGPAARGTGCAFASAVAAHLAAGHSLTHATACAQEYVAGALRHALTIGHGRAVLDHFWKARPHANTVY